MQDLLQRLLLAGGGGFSPSSLFAGGVAGAFYDPSDLSTLFQDSAGTTPVTGVEQVVGLMLDKSQNLALGPELLADPGFNNAASWETSAGVTITGGEAVWNTAGTSEYVRQPNITVANTYYEFTIVCSSYTSGTVLVAIGAGGSTLPAYPINATGTVRFRLNVGANSGRVWLLTPPGGAQLSITSFSVKQVLGNHATSTGSARPTLSARVNLLTKTEEFNDAYWSKNDASVSANSTTAPDGTLTADSLIEAATTAVHAVNRGTVLPNGVQSTVSCYFKAGTRTFALLGNPEHAVSINLTTGVVTSAVGATGNITSTNAGNGWWRVSFTATYLSNFDLYIYISNNGVFANRVYAGDGTSGIFVWGADLRPTNDGVNIPAYQRVNTATDYDTNGFPFYLSFGGAQSMSTPGNIDFATVTSDGQARRNIVTNPSLFNASGWAVTALAVTANATTAPDGSSSAYRLAEDSATSAHSLYQSIGTLTGTYTASAYVKPNGRTWCYMEPTGSGSTRTWFDLSGSGTVGTVGASVTAAIVALANGWYRISTTFTYPTSNAVVVVGLATSNNNVNYTGDGTSGVFLWGAQLETGSTATAFQNIGTDQMTVYAGVRKLSDAAVGMVTELSANLSLNNGAFWLLAPLNTGASGDFDASFKGTLQVQVNSGTRLAPVTAVVAATDDIGGRLAALRYNGSQVSSATSNQGTGNFGSYPLFIGARNLSSVFLNGRIYSLIVQGAAASATQLASTEAYVNQKTKAY